MVVSIWVREKRRLPEGILGTSKAEKPAATLPNNQTGILTGGTDELLLLSSLCDGPGLNAERLRGLSEGGTLAYIR